jgi:uncharacterized protein (TIGR00255 family)
MVSSMTGFARQESNGPWGTLVCEIRSVNHRFLDLSIRLPESCRSIEPELRQLLSRELRRGKVDCSVHHQFKVQGAGALEVDQAVLGPLLERARELLAAAHGAGHLNVLELLRWPGAVREPQLDQPALLAAVTQLFTETVKQLAGARTHEGARLSELITQRCQALATLVALVRARLPDVHQRIRARLEERLAELGGELNRERIEQEIVLLVQRLDVDEELDRLTGHIAEAATVLAGREPAGRRLDFLLQEFNREANTLSSKSQDLETTRAAVEIKVIIEQMREQVQNIE